MTERSAGRRGAGADEGIEDRFRAAQGILEPGSRSAAEAVPDRPRSGPLLPLVLIGLAGYAVAKLIRARR